MQIESQFQFSLLFASFYNFQYCKEFYSGIQSLFCMHNVCPHSTLCALVSPGQTVCYEGRETTTSNCLLLQLAYVSIWWLCQNVKWHNFFVLQETYIILVLMKWWQQGLQKTIGLISKTTTFHVHHTCLYISLPFLHDYIVKMPNVEFYGGRKQAMTSLDMGPRNSTPIWFAYIWLKWNSCDKDWKRLQHSQQALIKAAVIRVSKCVRVLTCF